MGRRHGDEKALDLKWSITRPSGYHGDRINLTVTDEASGLEFLDVEIELAEFALGLTGLSHRPAKGVVRGLDRLGMTCEVKTEIVTHTEELRAVRYSPDRDAIDAAAKRALAPLEVDGWIGTPRDLLNHHRCSGGDAFRVNFARWVDGDGTPWIPEKE